jgi:hypothetical protein
MAKSAEHSVWFSAGNEVLDCNPTINDLFELNKVQSVFFSKNKGCIAAVLVESLKRGGTKW